MDPHGWARDGSVTGAASQREWSALCIARCIDLGADDRSRAAGRRACPISCSPPTPPSCSTARCCWRASAIPSARPRSRISKRAFRALQARGLVDSGDASCRTACVLEGAGDCVWDQTRSMFWMGYGPRSDAAARDAVADRFGDRGGRRSNSPIRASITWTRRSVRCRGGEVMYVPERVHATRAGRRSAARVRDGTAHRGAGRRTRCRLAANAVCLGDALVMSGCSDAPARNARRARLSGRGRRRCRSFLRSGGAAFCLTLRLDRRLGMVGAEQDAAVA